MDTTLKPDPYAEFPEKANPTEGKFKLANQRILLTYRFHLDKEAFLSDFKQRVNFTPKFIRIAHETGDAACPYEHSHVLIDFSKAFQTTDCRFFDYIRKDPVTSRSITWVDEFGKTRKVIHPNIKIIKTAKHFDNARRYLGKEDPDNADLCVDEPNLFDKVAACKSKAEALRLCKTAGEATGMLTLYENRSREDSAPSRFHELTRWQLQVYALLREDNFTESIPEQVFDKATFKYTPEMIAELREKGLPRRCNRDRKIKVIYEPIGNTGKTFLGKELMKDDPERYYFMQGIAQKRDVATQIQNALASGWAGKVLLVNVCRTCADHKIYDAIESMRDGFMTSSKYQGCAIPFDLQHLVIFTNFMPDLPKTSLDRWEIYTINREDHFLQPMDLNEAFRIHRKEKRHRSDGVENDDLSSSIEE